MQAVCAAHMCSAFPVIHVELVSRAIACLLLLLAANALKLL